MEKSLEELGRRVIGCKNWRWMEGMNAITPDGLSGCRITPFTLAIDHYMLPDLTDPATLGCLLQLVREAWGDSEAHLALGAAGWALMSGESRVADVAYSSLAGKTEAETLVAALEAAP